MYNKKRYETDLYSAKGFVLFVEKKEITRKILFIAPNKQAC